MALRTKRGSWREAARDMRSAREFKEAFEEMASVSLFSSPFICESWSSCSFILFLDPESDDGGTIAKEKKYVRETRAGLGWWNGGILCN